MSGNIGGEALGEARLHAQCEATIRGLEAELELRKSDRDGNLQAADLRWNEVNARVRGLEAENRELREALRSFDEYKGNTCGWCDAEPGPLGKPQKHAPDCELAALLDVPQ